MSERELTGVAARIDARIPRTDSFTSDLRGPRTTARVGVWLGVAFAVAFATGLYSHASPARDPGGTAADRPGAALPGDPGPPRRRGHGRRAPPARQAVVRLPAPVRPAPQPRRELVLHLLERLSIALLVGAAIFQLVTGLANSAQWYPWPFSFVPAHYAVAWVAAGSLLVHVAVKLPVIRRALSAPVEDADHPASEGGAVLSPTRRTLLHATWLSAAVAVLATTAAELPGLRRIAVLAVRSGEGPQGVPINRSAAAAGVADHLDGTAWRLRVVGPARTVELSLDDLRAMAQRTAVLPIACVEGWSASGTWSGVPVRDVVALVGAGPDDDVLVRSMQSRGAWRESRLPANFVRDPDSLLALSLAGAPLHPDHGYPCRLIAPARPGVLQTKWVNEVQVEPA